MKIVRVVSVTVLVCCVSIAHANNSAFVDSKHFDKNRAACTVGVWMTNDVFLSAFVCPLEMRESSPAAYLLNAPFTRDFRAGARVRVSGLQDSRIVRTLGIPASQSCSGPVSNTYSGTLALNGSPDGLLFACFNATHPPLNPGSDLSASWVHLDTDVDGVVDDSSLVQPASSIFIVFTTDNRDGFFEVDTCCVTPASHLEGVEAGSNQYLPFGFTKGRIRVGEPPPNLPPTAICQNVQVSANGNCEGNVTPQMINNGSSDLEDGTNLTLQLMPSGPFAPGATNSVLLIVTDTQGATDTCEGTVTVLDILRPVALCPPDTAIAVSWGRTDTTFAFTGQAFDECPGARVSCEPPSGSIFPVGQSTVRCVAVDGSSNADTCEFRVTVFNLCTCDCSADPLCDGTANVLDVVVTVEIAFRGGADVRDPNELCPYTRTDATCDGVTDVLDVVAEVNVAFRGADPAVAFCVPCP